MDTIDLIKLVQALRDLPEEKELVERTPLNSYLRERLLPVFYADRYPDLNELDFEQFELEDLCDMAAYIHGFSWVEYNLMRLNDPICLAPPKATTARAFL